MKYLLDTNIVSALMKEPSGTIAERIRRVGQDAVATNVVVVAEVEYGIEKKRSKRLRAQFDRIRPSLLVLPVEEPADLHYAAMRVATERRGLTIGQNDLWIAAHALALDAVVVTDDRAFVEMPGLKVENWLRALSPHGERD
jgi:tRNA(fMet)-specific endonuclease VapC